MFPTLVPALARTCLTFLVCSGLAAVASPQPLELAEAVRLAEQRALATTAAESSARASRELAVAAAQQPDPVLRVALDNLPVDGPDRYSVARDFMTMRSVGVMQTFTPEAKRKARATRFEREADAALAERAVRAAAVRRDAALAWFERQAQERRVTLLLAQLELAGQQAVAAEAALRGAGAPGASGPARGTLADWQLARDAVMQSRLAVLAAEADQANARRGLARWTGAAPDRPLAQGPDLARSSWSSGGTAEQLAHHPQLQALVARESAAAAEADAARQEREPDWSAELMFSQRGSRYSNMVSMALSLPLPWDRPQRQDRELAARLAQADAIRAEREEAAREHRAEAERWIESWRGGLARLEVIDREREPLARQRAEASLAGYRGGSVTLAAVLEARRAALAVQLDRVEIELETARLWSRLEYLVPDRAAPAAKE